MNTTCAPGIWKPVGKQLGIPWLSWHGFRHSHATMGEQIAMALSDRQAQMGHGDVRMTLHYTPSDLDRRRAAIEVIAEKLVSGDHAQQNPGILTLIDTKREEAKPCK